MLRSAARMIGYRVSALDGEIGRCHDFLLEDAGWRARYLVAETGAWLSARQVPISPLELRKADWTSRRLVLEGQREQLRHRVSPEALSQSVAEEPERADPQRADTPPADAPPADTEPVDTEPAPDTQRSDTPPALELETHPVNDGDVQPSGASRASIARPVLGSLGELLGCQLMADGQCLGICEDVIVDDDTWSCPYLVLDNQDWLSGQKTLIPTEWIDSVDRENKLLSSKRSTAELEACPEYDPRAPGPGSAESLTGVRSVAHDPRSGWPVGSLETWGSNGLRAALARIILG